MVQSCSHRQLVTNQVQTVQKQFKYILNSNICAHKIWIFIYEIVTVFSLKELARKVLEDSAFFPKNGGYSFLLRVCLWTEDQICASVKLYFSKERSFSLISFLTSFLFIQVKRKLARNTIRQSSVLLKNPSMLKHKNKVLSSP